MTYRYELEPAERDIINTIRKLRAENQKRHTYITLEITRRDIRITKHVPGGILKFQTGPLPPVDT